MTQKLFCFGYGYVADFLARALLDQGFEVAGTTRDEAKAEAMRAAGMTAHIFSYNEPLIDPHHALEGVTHILVSTPADDWGDPTARFHGDDIGRLSSLGWLGYLSATSIYGDRGGDWVDEQSPIAPTARRGVRRARAEDQWLRLFDHHRVSAHIFRLAGIYGPGRNALDSVRAGSARRINKPGHAFSRIHVEDIVQTMQASMAQPNPGAIYNVADDYPSPSHEVIAYTCELLGQPLPPLLDYTSADLAPITTSFYADNKRIRNDRIKDELGVRLKYPTFREGMLACRAAEEAERWGLGLDPHWFAEGRDIIGQTD
jgi:hypothetical protein